MRGMYITLGATGTITIYTDTHSTLRHLGIDSRQDSQSAVLC
jgi:hypothetical protein